MREFPGRSSRKSRSPTTMLGHYYFQPNCIIISRDVIKIVQMNLVQTCSNLVCVEREIGKTPYEIKDFCVKSFWQFWSSYFRIWEMFSWKYYIIYVYRRKGGYRVVEWVCENIKSPKIKYANLVQRKSLDENFNLCVIRFIRSGQKVYFFRAKTYQIFSRNIKIRYLIAHHYFVKALLCSERFKDQP